MYNKNDFSLEARGTKMLADFEKSAKKCQEIARAADHDVPDEMFFAMCCLSYSLEAQIRAMRSRWLA
jgi:hypothetical protein